MEQQSNLKKENMVIQEENKEMNNSENLKIRAKDNKDLISNGEKNQNKKDAENKKGEMDKGKSFDKNSNVIFIGDKPLVNYIRGVITLFLKKEALEVVIKSRGRFISKAVDVAEVSKRSLADKNIIVKSINISSESFETEGKRTNISTMDIVLGK